MRSGETTPAGLQPENESARRTALGLRDRNPRNKASGFSGPEGRKTLAGDLEMAPGEEGAKPSGKGLVIHPVFADKGNGSPRQQKGCEVKR